MKYFLVLLKSGKVIDICSYDTSESRDDMVQYYALRIDRGDFSVGDDIQVLDIVS